jgi:hypothetical protein
MPMEYVVGKNVYRGKTPDGCVAEIACETFQAAPADLRDDVLYWEEYIFSRCDAIGDGEDPLAFIDTLSPVTQQFMLRWVESPWTLHEMLEDEPDKVKAATMLQELTDAGVIRYVDGVPLLYACNAE